MCSAVPLPSLTVSYQDVGPDMKGGHSLALQTVGDPDGIKILMLHGGPGYYWLPENLMALYSRLRDAGHNVCLQALNQRGCGIGEAISCYTNLLDDDLVKRAHDLAHFAAPDILLGHSTGSMVALTAIIEDTCRAKSVLLLSPYTASLGEHTYWMTDKAAKYPHAFARFYNFVIEQWQLNKGPVPSDLRQNYIIIGVSYFFTCMTVICKSKLTWCISIFM